MKTVNNKQLAVNRLKRVVFLSIFISQLITAHWQLTFAQQPSPIKKSNKIETIDGKKFHIHSVEKGQTLYSIAKTYETTTHIILSNNVSAIDGLKAGDKLKIPVTESSDATKKETKKGIPPKSSAADSLKKQRPPFNIKNIFIGPQKEVQDSGVAETEIKPIGDIHVAVFLPLSLEAVKEIDPLKTTHGDVRMPDEIKIGVEFYEGMKMALDSLKRKGFNGRLHVYDSNTDSAGMVRLLKKPEIKEMDLIIGPLYGKIFEPVLCFAKENKINIVSPTLQGNGMLTENPNTSKVTPSYVTQAEELAIYICEKYSGQNIISFNSAIPKDKPYLDAFKQTANPLLKRANADTVKEVTFSTLKNFITDTISNIVIIPSANQSFVAEAINNLYLHKQEKQDTITLIVFGMSNWEDIESLDFGYLNTLSAHISSCSFLDYKNPQTKRFILKYRKEFKTEPTQYVFLGFDVTYFYLNGLHQYGNLFQKKLPEIKQKGLQTEFNFYQPDVNSGYENKGIGIMKFENYSYKRVK